MSHVAEVFEAIELIHPTLTPLVLREQDSAILERPNLQLMKLPKVAANACKLASLILQAFWCLEKVNDSTDSTSDEVDDLLKHMWKGGHKHDTGFAISVLTKVATTLPPSSYLKTFVGETEVLHKWNRLFSSKLYAYRDYDEELRSENWSTQFGCLISELKVLRFVSYNQGWFAFGDKLTSQYPVLRNSENNDQVFYLHTFERVESNPRIVFESPFNNFTLKIDVDEDEGTHEYYKVLRQKLGFDDLHEGVIHLFGSGYRHLENLATAIAHAPGSNAREAYKWLEDNYAQQVRWINDIDIKRRKSDFVVMLLASEGPSKILRQLVGNAGFKVFDEYLTYLEPRVEGTREEWLALLKKQISTKEQQLSAYLGIDENKRREILDTINLETRCWCLLKAAEFDIGAPKPYVETIDMRIELVRNWLAQFEQSPDVYSVGVKLGKLVERTFKFLTCFYAGLEGYLQAKKDDRHSRPDRRSHEVRMLAEAARTMKNVWRTPAGSSMRNFQHRIQQKLHNSADDVDEVSEFTAMARESDDEEGIAYPLLGRKQICDMGVLERLASDEYVAVFNRIKHELLYDDPGRRTPRSEVTVAEMYGFIKDTIALFEFLRTGHDQSTSDDYSLEPIYPMIISFQEEHRNRDGLLIYDYEIYSLNRQGIPRKIRILTPHDYAPNEEYYCIPFYNRSTRIWWLDPFLIRCSQFDSVLLGESPEKTV